MSGDSGEGGDGIEEPAEDALRVVILQLLVGEVDAQLLKAVDLFFG